jgi:hypothetical protein
MHYVRRQLRAEAGNEGGLERWVVSRLAEVLVVSLDSDMLPIWVVGNAQRLKSSVMHLGHP